MQMTTIYSVDCDNEKMYTLMDNSNSNGALQITLFTLIYILKKIFEFPTIGNIYKRTPSRSIFKIILLQDFILTFFKFINQMYHNSLGQNKKNVTGYNFIML